VLPPGKKATFAFHSSCEYPRGTPFCIDELPRTNPETTILLMSGVLVEQPTP
jgi:hypothetical protein